MIRLLDVGHHIHQPGEFGSHPPAVRQQPVVALVMLHQRLVQLKRQAIPGVNGIEPLAVSSSTREDTEQRFDPVKA